MLPPPCFTIGMVPGFLQTCCLAFRPKSSILVSSAQRILFLVVWESLGTIWQCACHVMCLLMRRASVWPLYHEGLIGGVLQRWLSSGRFSHLYRGTLELCQSDHLVLGYVPDQGPSPTIAQFCRAASSRKSLGGSKLLSFQNDGGYCVLGYLKCCRNISVPFPRSVPRHNPSSELYGQFLPPHGLLFALTCTVNCIDRCVPFQIMSKKFNLPQVDSSQVVDTSQGWPMETGCTWAQFRVS